jgi:hypothetical protein
VVGDEPEIGGVGLGRGPSFGRSIGRGPQLPGLLAERPIAGFVVCAYTGGVVGLGFGGGGRLPP